MKKTVPAMKKIPSQHGPKPDMLKIDADWKEAISRSFEKKKPREGWPK